MIGREEAREAIARSVSLTDAHGRGAVLEEGIDPDALLDLAVTLTRPVAKPMLKHIADYLMADRHSEAEADALEQFHRLLAAAGASCAVSGILAGRTDARATDLPDPAPAIGTAGEGPLTALELTALADCTEVVADRHLSIEGEDLPELRALADRARAASTEADR
jgi:hypothetical protein